MCDILLILFYLCQYLLQVPAHSLAPYMSVQVDSQIPEGFSVPTSAAAGGLMSSAAAGVTALWRAAISRKDK